MIVRKFRLEKSWTQEQLADISGLSVRTIQRIERGQQPSLESIKSLAAAFDIEASLLTVEPSMTKETLTTEEQRAHLYVRDIKGFYSHLIKYLIVIGVLLIINIIRSPHHLWVIWPAMGWGLGVLLHGLNVFEVFNFFSPNWEKRQIEKRLGRIKEIETSD